MNFLADQACLFAAFLLASLACCVLARRGFLPLHVSALVGLGAYSFGGFCGAGWSSTPSALMAVVVTASISALISLCFSRARGGSAALATIGLQLCWEQYSQVAGWTGGHEGLWRNLPFAFGPAKLLAAMISIAAGFLMYGWFRGSVVARFETVEGVTPELYGTVARRPITQPLAVSGAVAGALAAIAAIPFTIQLGLVTPSLFTLHYSLLYVSVVLLVGHDNLPMIACGALLFSGLPAALRAAGLGSVSASAWQGVALGLAVLTIILLQAPRLRSRSPREARR